MARSNQIVTCLAALVAALPVTGAEQAHATDKPYRIAGGKVDQSTYLGWRAFHSGCHMCHGVDGTGTSAAPNLVERVKQLSAHDFTVKVLTSYRLVFQSDEAGADDSTAIRAGFVEEVLRRERGDLVMPAWEHDDKMRPHVLDLYAYLRARADGALGPGEPKRIAD